MIILAFFQPIFHQAQPIPRNSLYVCSLKNLSCDNVSFNLLKLSAKIFIPYLIFLLKKQTHKRTNKTKQKQKNKPKMYLFIRN